MQNKINIIQRTSGPVKAFKSAIHFPVLFQQHHTRPVFIPVLLCLVDCVSNQLIVFQEVIKMWSSTFTPFAGAHSIRCIHYFTIKWKNINALCLLNITITWKWNNVYPLQTNDAVLNLTEFSESSDVQKDGHASAAPDDIVENFTVAGNKFVESGTGQTKVSLQRMRCRSGEPPVDDNTLRRCVWHIYFILKLKLCHSFIF